jgi:hypothetical protein
VLYGFGCDDDNDSKSNSTSTEEHDHDHAQDGDHDHGDAAMASDDTKADAGKGDDAGKASGSNDTSGDTDYAKPENWLCRPDHNGACDVDLDATIVKADGSLEPEPFHANPDAPIDCFYVYPTVSLDPTPNSDLNPGPEENSVVRAQFARFASQCRLYAPMYRQVTLTALQASLSGTMNGPAADRMVGYRDVLAAWKYYLDHDNDGRGVVLVGHSQGSSVLMQLLKSELDKKPVDSRFIGALLMGTNVLVPKDKTVGGSYANLPICTKNDELGCIIVYDSFRANTPPSDTTMFASSTDGKNVAACTNPAALGGGSGELHAYLSKDGPGNSSNKMGEWAKGKTIDTPFVSVPGLLTAECKFAHTGSYLAITVNGDPNDPRTDDIVGDVVTNGQVQADWGLHLIDVHLAMGNLIDIVKAKAEAYAKK